MKKRKQKVCMFRFNARPRIVMPWTRLSGMRRRSSETPVVLSTGLSGCSGGLNPHRTDSETAHVGSVDCQLLTTPTVTLEHLLGGFPRRIPNRSGDEDFLMRSDSQ